MVVAGRVARDAHMPAHVVGISTCRRNHTQRPALGAEKPLPVRGVNSLICKCVPISFAPTNIIIIATNYNSKSFGNFAVITVGGRRKGFRYVRELDFRPGNLHHLPTPFSIRSWPTWVSIGVVATLSWPSSGWRSTRSAPALSRWVVPVRRCWGGGWTAQSPPARVAAAPSSPPEPCFPVLLPRTGSGRTRRRREPRPVTRLESRARPHPERLRVSPHPVFCACGGWPHQYPAGQKRVDRA